MPILRLGDRGPAVADVQISLRILGLLPDGTAVHDGDGWRPRSSTRPPSSPSGTSSRSAGCPSTAGWGGDLPRALRGTLVAR